MQIQFDNKESMLGKDLPQNKPQALTKSAYGDLDQNDYNRVIQEKDQIIRKQQFRIAKLEKDLDELMKGNSAGANSFYKKKLEQQIKDNEAATQMLINIGARMQKLADLLRLSPEKCQDSTEVKNILKMMGDGNGSASEHLDLDDSQMENMDAVQGEVMKKLEDLQTVCDSYHKNHNKIQKQYSSIDLRLKQIKKQNEEQVRALEKQANELRISKQHFKNLQQKAQEQKKQVLKSIANSIDAGRRKQLQVLTKQQLLQQIKKLHYKINQLDSSKREVMSENKKIKTADLEKYKKILYEVKEAKEMSRLGQSMM